MAGTLLSQSDAAACRKSYGLRANGEWTCSSVSAAPRPRSVAYPRSTGPGIGIGSPGGKSDAADAKVLADLVRTDRHLHRPMVADTDSGEELKMLRIWRRQGQINHLRSALREYYRGHDCDLR